MGTLPLNKGSLQTLRQRLAVYRRVLPSLDLKRRQLASRAAEARARLAALESEERAALSRVGTMYPMLGDPCLRLEELFDVDLVETTTQASLGVAYPQLVATRVRRLTQATTGSPWWTERLQEELSQALTRRLRIAATSAEREALERGLRRTLQRQNLFEKRLIPQAQAELRRIEVALDDAARGAVVRAKIARSRHPRTVAP